jgi:hypothetical protein
MNSLSTSGCSETDEIEEEALNSLFRAAAAAFEQLQPAVVHQSHQAHLPAAIEEVDSDEEDYDVDNEYNSLGPLTAVPTRHAKQQHQQSVRRDSALADVDL